MGDLKRPELMYLKAGLFVLCGLISSALLWCEQPTLKVALLLALSIWCFARAYYFVFYVIEHYIDPTYKFAGLFAFAQYLLRKRPPQ